MRLIAFAMRAVLVCLARVRVKGMSDLPRKGPLIVVANHASNSDPAFVGAWLQPALGRPIRFLAKEELFRWPLKPLLHLYEAIVVKRGGSDADAYRLGRAVLKRGEVLGVFPEGTRSRDGVLQDAFAGVTLLAARTESPVLPVGVAGSHRFLPRGGWVPAVGTRVTVRVGRPFRVTLDSSLDHREAVARATDDLMSHIATLLPPEQRGRYAPAVTGAER